ncbi:MAG TPA: endo-1,4-beta-xylanase [Candidatus Saccharimonadales bacterium]|nr:endo-1,4-beta-xylanase [Candidatus Saccharimonadales bacterium]
MNPTNLPTPQLPGPGPLDPNGPEQHDTSKQPTVAGHKLSKRDIILASVATGLLLFGVIMGLLGIFSSKPPVANNGGDDGKEVVDEADLLNHQWAYMPGAVRDKDGLRIIPDGFTIVKADGTAQPNPPINLYGTYLEEVKDITITAILTPGSGPSSLRLYTEPPIIGSDFRDERKSIDLGINGNVLSISTWDRAEPATNTYTFETKDKITLTVTRQNRIMTFTVNGKQVAALPEGNIFSSGKIWFGTDATTDSWTLNSLHAEALNNSRVTIADASKVVTKQATDSLQVLATTKRTDFKIGAVMALSPLVADAEYRQVALGQFGSLTPDHAMQWQFIHPANNDYDFAEADALVDAAKKSGLVVHGHSLLSSDGNPPWASALPITTDADKQTTASVMNDHIKTVSEHFKGKIPTWDVVDNALATPAEFAQGQLFRNNKWYQAMNQEYIARAFRAAKAADSDAKLFINESGLEKDGPRWEAFLNLVGELKRQGVPIDGAGLQAHVTNGAEKIDPAVLRKHIQQLKALDLKVRISAMDVYSAEGPENQSAQYTAVLDACLQEPTCISWTTGGVGNRYNYSKDAQGITRRGDDFLYNADLKPTLAADAVRDLLTR